MKSAEMVRDSARLAEHNPTVPHVSKLTLKVPPMNIDDIVTLAATLTDPTQRAAYLDQACGDDAELRRRVEDQLQAKAEPLTLPGDAKGTADFALNASGVSTVAHPILEDVGAAIGPYKLLQKLGEGGMGVVYLAEQLEPVRRKVALKIIKPGMDTAQVVARLRRTGKPGADGASQHRQGVRRRRHQHGAAILRHGVGAWRGHHQVLR